MSAPIIPSDATSLLVPIHLDAWVVDSQNQQSLAIYNSAYEQLTKFKTPVLSFTDTKKPATGVHLHWALPDALTHGVTPKGGGRFVFPKTPNRWLVIRFNTPAGGQWKAKLWVVQSDYLNTDGASAYLDPFNETRMNVAPNTQTSFNLHTTNIGKNYTVDAWETMGDPGNPTFLTAVGPGNVAFSSYVPFAKDVFSFTDTTLPDEGTGVYAFTYMVVGWYSIQDDDPLNALQSYVEGIWDSGDQWQKQSVPDRLQTLLDFYKWSASVPKKNVPTSSLYHGTVVGVQWPFSKGGDADIVPQNISISIANSSADALAAMVQAQANANANNDKPDPESWIEAGNTLASLIQASMYDMFDDFGKPGCQAIMNKKIRQAWYSSKPGGTQWSIVSRVPVKGQSPVHPTPTADEMNQLNVLLAQLNIEQSGYDENVRQLQSLQEDLYRMWLKIGIGNAPRDWGDDNPTPDWDQLFPFIQNTCYPDLFNAVWTLHCTVNTTNLPDPASQEEATKWVDTEWKITAADGTIMSPTQLGLTIKAAAAPRFWAPSDPVLMISGIKRTRKFGEDGRYSDDGTLMCRLPGEIISGLEIQGQPAISGSAQQVSPFGNYTSIPSIPSLVLEAFLTDPANAALMASTVSGLSASTIVNSINNLLNEEQTNDKWTGTPPVPFAIVPWNQAWSPLFLEWDVYYYPTGQGIGEGRGFQVTDWTFDGNKFLWNGTGFDSTYSIPYSGRTILTPQAQKVFGDKVAAFLNLNSDYDTQQIDTLIKTLSDWDILSQSMSGFTDQLITLLTQETFPPPQGDMSIPCPVGSTPPTASALIDDQYHHMPLLNATRNDRNYFYPVRGGFIQFHRLRVIDSFGQVIPVSAPNTPQGFTPIIDDNLKPTKTSPTLPFASIQFPPQIIQDTRLNMTLLANDGSAQPSSQSPGQNAISGWLLPNHLDGGISVYDESGVLLGELLPLAPPNNWRPRPGNSATKPPQTPADIPNPVLKGVVVSIANQSVAIFNDFLKVVDETLWTTDPLGGRRDHFLSVMIGRPLAVTRMSLQLQLMGEFARNQLWEKTAIADSKEALGYRKPTENGGVDRLQFPVRLGDPDLRDDGLIGYFFNDYSKFYSVYTSSEISSGDQYIKQIQNDATYQGDIHLRPNVDTVTVTMLIDPRGSVNASTGILPVTTASLPPHLIEDFIQKMKVTFLSGPTIADPGSLRLPKPAEQHGSWKWIEALGGGRWEEDDVINADDKARMPDEQLRLREGWLQLSDLDDKNKKSKQ